jgi:hypothetical protein
MNPLSRRQFLLFLGAGAVVIGGGAALTVRQLTANAQGNTLTFKAITALPAKPMPGYASYVIDGQVDITNNSGAIAKNVFAGPPEEITNISMLTRNVRVTGVQRQGSKWLITGVVKNQTEIQPGEEKTFSILLDPAHSVAQSTFFGSPIQLALQNFTAPS